MPDKFSATIGNFDGIHRGHMKLISHVLSYAEKNNTKSKAITFNPYPFEYYLLPDQLGLLQHHGCFFVSQTPAHYIMN